MLFPRWILLVALAVGYYVPAWLGLFLIDAGIVATSVILFGIPAIMLARFSAAPPGVLISVAALGLGISIMLEGIAHIYGLWYTIGVEEWRLFGLVPLEVMIATILEVLFLVLLYELLFDDRSYQPLAARARFGAIAVFGVGFTLLLGLYQWLDFSLFFTHSFLAVLLIAFTCTIAALSIHHVYSVQFVDRLVYFTSVGMLPGLIALMLSLSNTHKVYANTPDYLFSFSLYNAYVPLEAVLLVVLLPFFVATAYELYLDDRA